jgi:hypothetical protein
MEARPRALAERSEGCYISLHTPCSSRITPSTSRDTATVSKTGHTIIVGLPVLRVRSRNLLDGSEPPRTIRARDEATQRVTTSWGLIEVCFMRAAHCNIVLLLQYKNIIRRAITS